LNLLLDTHVILWSAAEPERFPPDIARTLESDANERWFSPISVWEILLLAEKGRIRLRPHPENGIRALLKTLPLREAVLNHEVAVQSRLVDLPHQDPADRFIAATAQVFGLTLVTADKRLLDASGFSVLPIST
jgi:PIN domain nuclease of toxin-antitoxin system